jgi:molybdenum storage protein
MCPRPGAVKEQEVRRSRHGVPVVGHEAFGALPLDLSECRAAIFPGMPPYDMWQHVPSEAVIPPYRTDAGCYLVAEAYVKEADGVFTGDPGAGGGAPQLIPRISATELLAMDLGTLPVDAMVLRLMAHAKHVHEIQIVDGLVPGNIRRAPVHIPAAGRVAADAIELRAAAGGVRRLRTSLRDAGKHSV